MKLIIDIPEEQKRMVDMMLDIPPQVENDLISAIRHGIPLDDVKAEMERANRTYPYTNHGILEAIAIIDKYIGKAESEDNDNTQNIGCDHHNRNCGSPGCRNNKDDI